MDGPWEFEAHPAVWLLIAGIVALGYYAVRHIGPMVVPAGQTVVTKRQKRCFVLAVFLLWVAADWPMHDIAEEHLYSVHMGQHLLIAFIVPPLMLLAIPEWLARLIVIDGGVVVASVASPYPAGGGSGHIQCSADPFALGRGR